MCFLAIFYLLFSTNTFGRIWDLGFKYFMDFGIYAFSPVLPYVWRNAYGVEFWILDSKFYGFVLFSAPSASQVHTAFSF